MLECLEWIHINEFCFVLFFCGVQILSRQNAIQLDNDANSIQICCVFIACAMPKSKYMSIL